MKFLFELNVRDAQFTGGKTGSLRVIETRTGLYHQLKSSILFNPSMIRRIKANYTDRENFGEVIASFVGRSLSGKNKIPNVELVYDPTLRKIYIASEYLQGDKGEVKTLDEYAIENKIHIPKGKHVICVAGKRLNRGNGILGLDTSLMSSLKQSLADALVLSALLGDHDVNPSNMLVIKKDDTVEIARIDLGHALNDLLNASAMNGGKLTDPGNPVLDFFNREKVAGIGGAPSKLWRDYPGMVPSQEIVNALKFYSEDANARIKSGISDAKSEFIDLIDEVKMVGDSEGLQHVFKSLIAIYENIGGDSLSLSTDLTIKELLDKVFLKYEEFFVANCDNAKIVANVMQVQLDIDQALINGVPLPEESCELLNNKNLPMKDGTIQWVKTGNKKPFSGDFDEYTIHRANQLIKQPQTDKENIINNYRKLRELILREKILHNTAPCSYKNTAQVSFFGKDLQEIPLSNPFHAFNTYQLICELQSYIDERMTKGDNNNVIGYSKEVKVNAANALIGVLCGQQVDNFTDYYNVLKDGYLCELISSFVKEVPGSKQEKVGLFLMAIEYNDIPLAEIIPDMRFEP